MRAMHIEPELLSAYLDNEVGEEERRAIEAHLRTCAECRRELAELRWTTSLLSQLPEVREPRPFYVRRTDLEPARPRWQTWLVAWRPLFRVASYAGTAVVLVLLMLNVLTLNTSTTNAPMPTAMEEMEAQSAPMAEKAAEPAGEALITAEEESAAEEFAAPPPEEAAGAEMSSALTRTTTETMPAASADMAAVQPTPEKAPPAAPPMASKPLIAWPRLTLAALLFTLLAGILYRWSSRWEPPDR